jgi:hypothetical protein
MLWHWWEELYHQYATNATLLAQQLSSTQLTQLTLTQHNSTYRYHTTQSHLTTSLPHTLLETTTPLPHNSDAMLPPSTSLHIRHLSNEHLYKRYMSLPNLPQLPPSPGPAPTWPLPPLPLDELRRYGTGKERDDKEGYMSLGDGK